VRCAETTFASYGTPSASSTSAAADIVSQSLFEPMIRPTSGCGGAGRGERRRDGAGEAVGWRVLATVPPGLERGEGRWIGDNAV
jgi:hypothetical protein